MLPPVESLSPAIILPCKRLLTVPILVAMRTTLTIICLAWTVPAYAVKTLHATSAGLSVDRVQERSSGLRVIQEAMMK